jgi:hypothetical protein
LFCFKGRDGRRGLLISVGVRTISVSRGAPISRLAGLQRHVKAVADLFADTGNAELPRDHDEVSLPAKDLIGTTDV